MKRFMIITALFSAGLLATWVIFDAYALSRSEVKSANLPVEVQKHAVEMAKINQAGYLVGPVMGAERKVAPVFDVTGVVVSDPSGMMANANPAGDISAPAMGANRKIAPVFDRTGAVVSDPTGTLVNGNQSGAVPVAGRDMKIAPVFDTSGRIVSDPTGTILGANN